MAVRIQFRRGTTSQWSSTNPILASGEVGFDTTLKQFKVGTGDIRWNDLAYYAIGTITEVVAGSGLVGGGSNGSVTLSLSSQALTTDYVSAKGDLITATADNSPTLLSVGTTDGDVLQVTSSQPTGLSYGKVQTSAIANNAVTETKILDTSVSTNKLADNAVTAGKLATNAVTATKIAANAVTEAKIADGSVSNTKLANNAVNTAQIADLAVTGSKFADNSITSAKIANNTIVNEDVNEFANIALSKLANGNLPSGIKATTNNYTNQSITVDKLGNGVLGVGVWEDWTPTIIGTGGTQAFQNSQVTFMYCKYMVINNLCTSWMILQFKNRTETSYGHVPPVLRFSLPLTPSFVGRVPNGMGISMGRIYHSNMDVPTGGGAFDAVYRVGWNGTVGMIEITSYVNSQTQAVSTPTLESGDIISFVTTYEVNAIYTPVSGTINQGATTTSEWSYYWSGDGGIGGYSWSYW